MQDLKTVDQFKKEVDLAADNLTRLGSLMSYIDTPRDDQSIDELHEMVDYMKNALDIQSRKARTEVIDRSYEIAKFTAKNKPKPY